MYDIFVLALLSLFAFGILYSNHQADRSESSEGPD